MQLLNQNTSEHIRTISAGKRRSMQEGENQTSYCRRHFFFVDRCDQTTQPVAQTSCCSAWPWAAHVAILRSCPMVLFALNMQKIAEACFLVSTCAQKFSSQSHYCSGIKQSSSCFVTAYSQVSTGVSKGCIIEKCSILIGFHAELDAIVQFPTQLG